MQLELREKRPSCTNGFRKIISSLLCAVHLIQTSGRGHLKTDSPAELAQSHCAHCPGPTTLCHRAGLLASLPGFTVASWPSPNIS